VLQKIKCPAYGLLLVTSLLRRGTLPKEFPKQGGRAPPAFIFGFINSYTSSQTNADKAHQDLDSPYYRNLFEALELES
jgi:hypothetical protein